MSFKPRDRVRIIGCTSEDPAVKALVGKTGTVLSHAYGDKHRFQPESHDVEVDGVEGEFCFQPSELELLPAASQRTTDTP